MFTTSRRSTQPAQAVTAHVAGPRIGSPTAEQEREADRLASRVTGIDRPEPRSIPTGGSTAATGHPTPGQGRPLDPAIRAAMERGFARSFGAVRVHREAATTAAARALGAAAYAVGDSIVVGDAYEGDGRADRWILAHELAHITMADGDRTVIRRFTPYTGADQAAGKSQGWKHPAAATNLRVADDGQMVVEDKGWGANKGKRAWTTSTLLAAANVALAAGGSRAKLKAKGGSISGIPPGQPKAASVTLDEIEPVNAVGGGPLSLAADCGEACKQVMGSGGPGKDVAIMRNPAGREKFTKARDYYAKDSSHAHTTPEDWTEEVFKAEFGAGLTRAQAYDKYSNLNAAQKDAFDKKYGINKYATPHMGQGLTVSTDVDQPGYADYPGMSAHTWNFHYAATVITSGSDYVTLENAAGWAPTDWIFFMYGPESKAQSFHEFHGATKTHGTKYTTLVVQPETALDRKVNRADAPALMPDGKVRKLALGTTLRVVQEFRDAGLLWVQVEVKSGVLAGTTMTIQKAFTE